MVLTFSRMEWLGLFCGYFRSFPDWRLCGNHYLVIREGAMQRGGEAVERTKGLQLRHSVSKHILVLWGILHAVRQFVTRLHFGLRVPIHEH